MTGYPRVAFFTDSYHETNGVAHTSRQLEAYARRERLPFLCIRAGDQTRQDQQASVVSLDLKRSPIGFGLEHNLRFDFLMWRHLQLARQVTAEFQADLVHITGPSDIGQLGARIAFRLGVPLVISWHTNLHEYAGKRLDKLFAGFPTSCRRRAANWGEENSLKAVLRFYKLGRLLLAPNEELVDLLRHQTGKPTSLIRRGVDAENFTPVRRTLHDPIFRFGYVGRLSPEKNVRFLAELEQALIEAGKTNFRFIIVGDGSERVWLERHMRFAEFTGILKGEALARVYANMDVFVFPSPTDTFGNVILEAFASGVPAIVSSHGGPKFLIRQGVNGFVAQEARDFYEAARQLISNPDICERMGLAARQSACSASWDSVFEKVYEAYRGCLQGSPASLASLASLAGR